MFYHHEKPKKENKLLKTVCVCASVSICFPLKQYGKKEATNEMKEGKNWNCKKQKKNNKVKGKIKS